MVVVVVVCLLATGAFALSGNPFSKEPKAEATTATKPVYPERGYADAIAYDKSGTVKGCDKDVASTELADSGGTVSVNGLLVKSEWTDEIVTVTFSDTTPFVSGYVIGSDSTEPFNMPAVSANEHLAGITLDTADFSKSGTFQDIVLCGGGM